MDLLYKYAPTPSYEAKDNKNSSLVLPATILEIILREVNDLHAKVFSVCLTRKINLDDSVVPGVPTGRRDELGIKGDILDVIDEIDLLSEKLRNEI